MDFRRTLGYSFPLVRGEDVRAVQQALIALKVQPPCGTADGVYGAVTRDAVRGFQRAYNTSRRAGEEQLDDDGVVGPKTWQALFVRAAGINAPAAHIRAASAALRSTVVPTYSASEPPPLNEKQMRRAKAWLMENFGTSIEAAVAGTSFDADLICAIAGKETAIHWLGWTTRMSPADILARCVFDASGDDPSSPRSAFPVNTAEFRARYGDALTDDLIAEANLTRRLRKMSDAKMVYKGYGIFQYDLQHIQSDEEFFRNKLWRSFDACLDRCMSELHSKLQASGGDVYDAVRRYNGSGARAREYAAHVWQMRGWAAEQPVIA